jgi:hypothetical protein
MGDISLTPRSAEGEKTHYSQGWNARVNNLPYDDRASAEWKLGWQDCREAKPEQRVLI